MAKRRNDTTESADPGVRFVRYGAKRRCPGCGSGNWERLGPDYEIELDGSTHLPVRFRCIKCQTEFLVEEYSVTKFVQSADKCVHCGSGRVEPDRRDIPDVVLYRCRQCHGAMVMRRK